jgi:hypothetical protein
MLKKMKDAALSKGIKIAVNTQIREYGKMLKFNLDSQNKQIDIEVMLEGEQEPLAVHVGKYELTEGGGIHFLRIYDVTTSRAWINTLASTYLEGKTFEIPEEYAKMLKIIV